MSARVHRLLGDDVDRLPQECRTCTFWELPTSPRGPQPARADEAAEAKKLWWRAMELDWGPPGLLLRQDGHTIAYAAYVPAEQANRTRRLGTKPSDDALVLTTIWVDPDARGAGVARMLLHRVLRHAHDAGFRAVEATGARTPTSTCLLPEGFLQAVGFTVLHEHPRYPLLRLDLRQTVRWQEAMEHALEGVRAVLGRRDPRTAPTTS
ncbi:MAG TPA: GNAT family N-acetyltransferase [Euzebyales bacterium]